MRTGTASDPLICDFTVEDLHLVDCAPPEAFDALTRLAQSLFGVPVALISIVEEQKDRQFFLSQQGLRGEAARRRQTPITESFCQHVKRTGKPLSVANANAHPTLRDHSVIEGLGVVAYLGVPIRKPGGEVIGALCIIEEEARVWEERDLNALKDLARCVNDEIALRASMAAAQAREARAQRYNALRESVMLAFVAPDIAIEDRFLKLLKLSCEALGFDAGLIARVDADSCDIEFRHDALDDVAAPTVNCLPDSLASFVISGQRQVALNDVCASTHVGMHALTGRVPGQYVGLPLIFGGTMYGVLELYGNQVRSAPFTDEEQSIFGIISMFVCAHLGMLGRIRALQNSEANLMNFLIEAQHSGLSRSLGRQHAAGIVAAGVPGALALTGTD